MSLLEDLQDSVVIEEAVNAIKRLTGTTDEYKQVIRTWCIETLFDVAYIPTETLVVTARGNYRVKDLPDNPPDAPVLCFLPWHDALAGIALHPSLAPHINNVYKTILNHKYRKVSDE